VQEAADAGCPPADPGFSSSTSCIGCRANRNGKSHGVAACRRCHGNACMCAACHAPAVAAAAVGWQVFVAGATGNTGRRVVQQLRAAGYKVKAGVRVSGCPVSNAGAGGQQDNLNSGVVVCIRTSMCCSCLWIVRPASHLQSHEKTGRCQAPSHSAWTSWRCVCVGGGGAVHVWMS
jgi:hypothetical protein